jgi:predicted peptidase
VEGAWRLVPATLQPTRLLVGRWLENSYWRSLPGDSIQAIWREGFYGPIFRMHVDGDTLRGTVLQTTDVFIEGRPRPQPQPVTAVRVRCPVQPTQTGFLDRHIRRAGADYPYQVYVPRVYDANVAWPVILFLHGAGERGTDGVRQTAVGLGAALRLEPERWPAIVVFPQAPPDSAWSGVPADVAMAALDRTLAEFSTDRRRVYLTGMSLGGNGVWYLAYRNANVFAAIAPVCAWVTSLDGYQAASHAVPPSDGEPFAALAERLAGKPTWIFHGEVDPAVPVEESRRAAEALRARGADVRYTELPGTGHNAWDAAYRSAGFAAWLLAQRRTR